MNHFYGFLSFYFLSLFRLLAFSFRPRRPLREVFRPRPVPILAPNPLRADELAAFRRYLGNILPKFRPFLAGCSLEFLNRDLAGVYHYLFRDPIPPHRPLDYGFDHQIHPVIAGSWQGKEEGVRDWDEFKV